MQKQDRSVLWIEKGATISNNGRDYVVVALADINLVLAKEVGSGEKVLLKIGDLEPPRSVKGRDPQPIPERNLENVSEEDWRIAEESTGSRHY